jgi:transcriptional regulator with XRE-family HTH domain
MEILLKFVRYRQNMTQEELSRKSGVSRSYISKIERGEREPTISVICKLANALGVKPEDLYICK